MRRLEARSAVDRLLEGDSHFVLRGRSYRIRHLDAEADDLEPEAA